MTEAGAALAASGAMISDLTTQYQAMFYTRSRDFDAAGVNRVLAGLKADCDAFARGPGAGAADTGIDWSTEARYTDQAWEIEVPLRQGGFEDGRDVDAFVTDFHRMHQDIFAVSDPFLDSGCVETSVYRFEALR